MDLPLDEVGEIAAWTPFAAATGWATGSIVKLLIAVATLALGCGCGGAISKKHLRASKTTTSQI